MCTTRYTHVVLCVVTLLAVLFFFNATATTEIYTYCHTLSLHDALPIFHRHDIPRARRNETALALGNPGPGGLMALGPCLDHDLGHQDVDAFGIAPDRKGGADRTDADAADVDHEGAVRVVRDLETRFALLPCAMSPLRVERGRDADGGIGRVVGRAN